MEIRSKTHAGNDQAGSDQAGNDQAGLSAQVRPAWRATPARDIVAALLLTLAAAILIGAATTTRSDAPHDKRIEAAAGSN